MVYIYKVNLIKFQELKSCREKKVKVSYKLLPKQEIALKKKKKGKEMHVLNNSCVKVEITLEIRKYFQLNDNEHTTFQN